MNKVVEKWDEILQIVKTEHDLSDVSFNTWLKPLTVYEVVDNVVTIIVPSEQVGLNYISKKYKLPLQVTISEVTGMENINMKLMSQLPEWKTVTSISYCRKMFRKKRKFLQKRSLRTHAARKLI